jgi:hypothetical protein
MQEEHGARRWRTFGKDPLGGRPADLGRLTPDGVQRLEQAGQGLDLGAFSGDIEDRRRA